MAVRLLELYSGIGGMHAAIRESGLPFKVVGTFEINTSALEVYRHNFPGISKPRNIMGLTAGEMETLRPDLIMMSPPCQPFTRQGLRKDIEDARTSSFLHFLGLLEAVTSSPKMILLENVVGFENSQARNCLVEVLKKKGYTWQEFLLSPTDIGVPNSRLRYYLLAKLEPECFCFPLSAEIMKELPFCLCCRKQPEASDLESVCHKCKRDVRQPLHDLLYKFHSEVNGRYLDTCTSFKDIESSLEHYIDDKLSIEPFLLSDKLLQKYFMILDIVDHKSHRSCCFTKGYAHYVEGTGSVVQHNTEVVMPEIYLKVQELAPDDPERVQLLRSLMLRYFTPEEVTRLMCFPQWFTFPPTSTNKQKYKLLGNSVNVLVVTCLLHILVDIAPVIS